jgi:hypothetical protein
MGARKVDPIAARRGFNQTLELAKQKEKIQNQRAEIAKLKQSIKAHKDAMRLVGAGLHAKPE